MTAKCTCRIVYHPPREAPKDHRPVPWQPCIEQKCNLCASAPELLEACRVAVGHFDPICDQRKDRPVLDRLEAAIAHAEAPMNDKGEPK